MAHSIAPPSGRNRVVQCPGSLSMERHALAVRPWLDDTEDQRLGTASHFVAETLGKYGVLLELGVPIAPHGILVDDEMRKGAQLMISTIANDLGPLGMSMADVAIEVPVDCKRIHPLVWGTPDYRAWVPADRTGTGRPKLFIWDYKFGHSLVQAFGCYQLTDYASGSLAGLGWNGQIVIDVEIVIVQPRSFHVAGPVRRWSTDTRELRDYFETSALAVHEALDLETPPRLRVGVECENCMARPTCPALQAAGLAGCDASFRAQVHDLTPAERGRELRYLERALSLMTARRDGLKEDVEAGLRRGQMTPGWRFESGLGRQIWKIDKAVVVAIGDECGVDVRKPVEVITPKQALDAGFPRVLVEAYSHDVPGAARLVEDDGSRARQIFGAQRTAT